MTFWHVQNFLLFCAESLQADQRQQQGRVDPTRMVEMAHPRCLGLLGCTTGRLVLESQTIIIVSMILPPC